MSAETLRRAAALMRERAAAASSPPWVAFRAHDRAPHGGDWIGVTRDLAVDYDPDVFSSQRCSVSDAEHIASWHPAVAVAVADWLSMQADHGAGRGAVCDSCVDQALAVANAYLQETP